MWLRVNLTRSHNNKQHLRHRYRVLLKKRFKLKIHIEQYFLKKIEMVYTKQYFYLY